jgi:hypothetical protein
VAEDRLETKRKLDELLRSIERSFESARRYSSGGIIGPASGVSATSPTFGAQTSVTAQGGAIATTQGDQKTTTRRGKQPTTEDVPHKPIKLARVSAERLAMLASARRNRLGDSTWAAISGFVASLPAAAHDVLDAYTGASPTGLTAVGLLEVSICVGFFAFMLTALLWDRGKSADQMVREILDPEGAAKDEEARKEARRSALKEAVSTIVKNIIPRF